MSNHKMGEGICLLLNRKKIFPWGHVYVWSMVINTMEKFYFIQKKVDLLWLRLVTELFLSATKVTSAGLSKSRDHISLNVPFPGNLASQYSPPTGPGILSLQETQQWPGHQHWNRNKKVEHRAIWCCFLTLTLTSSRAGPMSFWWAQMEDDWTPQSWDWTPGAASCTNKWNTVGHKLCAGSVYRNNLISYLMHKNEEIRGKRLGRL